MQRNRTWADSRVGRAVAVALVLPLLAGVFAATSLSVGAPSRAQAAIVPPTLGGVESLYAADLVSRIDAERAARSTGSVPIPQLQVDPNLQATAQAWSAHLAATGTVTDPTLTACVGPNGGPPSASQLCELAANSGDTGYGFWPGDGSDGMNADYMESTYHRENLLGAGYTSVGVGVTCSGGQAYTVELFGYQYGDVSSANARQGAQNVSDGNPVAPSPMVAGTQTGEPVYCPGQTVGPGGRVTATGGQYPYPYSVPSVPGEPDGSAAVGMASTPDGNGYWVASADGAVTTYGDAVSYGSMDGAVLTAPITHVVATADGKGYWLVAADGGVFAFGDAAFYGSIGGQRLNAPVVDIAPTSDGRGYWLVASDGGIFAFGDAAYRGSMGGHLLSAPIVGMAPDAATDGYWLVGSDGGVFAFDAPFLGSTGSVRLNRAVVGMTAAPNAQGYWFVASDGGIFSFGSAKFLGSTGSVQLNAPIVGMATDPVTGGYWLGGSDGGVFAFGAPFFGAG